MWLLLLRKLLNWTCDVPCPMLVPHYYLHPLDFVSTNTLCDDSRYLPSCDVPCTTSIPGSCRKRLA